MGSVVAAGHDAVQKVTLIPRGQARGLTWFIPGEDPTLISKQQIFARIVGALGGRATEQVVFGDAEVTTGASSDLQQVDMGTPLVSNEVCNRIGFGLATLPLPFFSSLHCLQGQTYM